MAADKSSAAGDVPPYQTYYFDMPLDHFGFFPTNPPTFKLRYLICNSFWDHKSTSPIFFYTGNEGDITMFYSNTGIMFEWAPKFGALVVFAEHRYYGESLPFGNRSFVPENARFLTSEQALADYAVLLTQLKSDWGVAAAPVVAFGGSYGGMLSAWFRVKYPHVVVGAISSSAPVAQFEGLTSPYDFNLIATKDFADCSQSIRNGFRALYSTPYATISDKMKLCAALRTEDDFNHLWRMLYDAITYTAMTDYPYPTHFLQPLPAWPVTEICKRASKESDPLVALRYSLDVYFNTTGDLHCFNLSQPDSPTLGDEGWDYQACTEMVMPMANDGVNDMFYPAASWDLKEYVADCQQRLGGTYARPLWIAAEYGGRDMGNATNIVFSNGSLDPWYAGGVLKTLSQSIVAIWIADGAHHLDLRTSHPADPPSVVAARKAELQQITNWLNGGR